MKIRHAKETDIPAMLRIYEIARAFMVETGNPTQWADSGPSEETAREDIAGGNAYVIEDEAGRVIGTFVWILGDDATYERIDDGAWPDDRPYGTIHRIANDGAHHGILEAALDYCFGEIDTVRIDTHADNKVMLRKIAKNGFVRCGIIYQPDGSPRIAFQKTRKEKRDTGQM